MTDKSPREIERDLERERAELRGTIDEIFNRMTLEGAWNRAGVYMRENHDGFGQTLGRVIKEKPIAVGLAAIGMAWIMFGSSSTARRSSREERFGGADARSDAETRAHLAAGDFSDTSAQGPTGPETRPDPWAAPTRTPASTASAPTETGAGGTSSTSPTKSTSNTSAGAAPRPTEDPSGSGNARGGTASTPTSPANSGGMTSAGSTPGVGSAGAGTSDTTRKTTTSEPKSSKT